MKCDECGKEENNLKICLNHPDSRPQLCDECAQRHALEEKKWEIPKQVQNDGKLEI